MPDQFNKFLIITSFGEGLSIAHHLIMEGKDVLVGMVDDMQSVGEKESEDKDTHKLRWTMYDGILQKMTVEKLMDKVKNFKDKEEWCVLFDFNTQWRYAEEFLKMGFIYGLFPSRLDYKLESDREFAKQFVLKNYPGVKVAEVEEFKDIEGGIEFINESDEFWALKGNDTSASTVVPRTKLIENVKAELIDALQAGKESYEKKGFIFERQIRDGLEVCPEMIFMDGKRVASNIDLEDKGFSATDSSEMYGCSLNVIRETPMECPLNEVAFPEAVDKLAKKHQGLFYIDANFIIKDGEYYYLEYCPNRMGYDAVYAEIEMSDGPSNYFNALLHGENPYKRKFGAGKRGFMQKREEDGTIKDGIAIHFPEELQEHLWFWGCKKGDGKYTNTKGSFGDATHGIDLVAFTESSDDIDYAKQKLQEVINQFSFSGLYVRENIDCICNRLDGLEKFINNPA